jgi:sulfur carrier protein
MLVSINGVEHELPEPAHITDALHALGVPESGVAVAVDDEVVPRADWSRYPLSARSRVEVLTAVQGG